MLLINLDIFDLTWCWTNIFYWSDWLHLGQMSIILFKCHICGYCCLKLCPTICHLYCGIEFNAGEILQPVPGENHSFLQFSDKLPLHKIEWTTPHCRSQTHIIKRLVLNVCPYFFSCELFIVQSLLSWQLLV